MPSNSDSFAPAPRVTFIIPVLNAAGLLENCLQSIPRQDYPQEKFEIIVGDAGSTDGTRELAKNFGALVVDDHGRNIEDASAPRSSTRLANTSFSLTPTTKSLIPITSAA